jgi:hypothetical protein
MIEGLAFDWSLYPRACFRSGRCGKHSAIMLTVCYVNIGGYYEHESHKSNTFRHVLLKVRCVDVWADPGVWVAISSMNTFVLHPSLLHPHCSAHDA